MIKIGNDWDTVLKGEQFLTIYEKIEKFLALEQENYRIFPPVDKRFTAFKLTPFKEIKVVIIGQDPYHEIGQAHGLSFSVEKGVKLPPSLKNIFKELNSDLGVDNKDNGNLTDWAKQGVLLLNATLTVREGQPNSHQKCGWEKWTNLVIKEISQNLTGVIFLLWGGNARKKKSLIDESKHFVLESAHPSPLSCYNGFWGSKPFSKINKLLIENGKNPINWQL